jgi:putative FmdB family regulatory protein
MPIYEYHCDACQADFEHMATMKARDQKTSCPQCGSSRTARKLSAVAVGSGDKPASSSGHVHSGCCCCGGGGNRSCPMKQG